MNTVIREYSTEFKYKILGFNDDKCECEICGKQELKGTYAIEDILNGGIIRAGSSCGAKMAGWTSKELVAKYKAGEKEKKLQAQKEYRTSAEYIAYENAIQFLNEETDKINEAICNELSHEKRNQLAATKRDLRSRLDYLQPFGIAQKNKMVEINIKYGYKPENYIV